MGPRRFVIVLAGLLSACGLIVGPASGACAFAVQWNGVVYFPADTDQAPRFGPSLGQAIDPPCNDQGQSGCSRDEGEGIAVFRLPGIDPHIAVGAERQALLAPGFFPSLPSHPLHTAIYGSETQPNGRLGWHCDHDPLAGLVGTVTQAGSYNEVGVRFEGDRVQREYGYTEVEVDARTSVTGFDDYGIPHIVEGDHLRAAVRECGSGRRYKVVAVSIAATP